MNRREMRNRRGITLIELVVMIAVAAALFASVSRGYQSLVQGPVDNRNYLIALNLAKRQMAIMNASAYPAAATTTPASDAAFPGFTFSQVVTEVTNDGAGGNTLRRIQMDVLVDGRVLVRLYTYRSNIITFGNGS